MCLPIVFMRLLEEEADEGGRCKNTPEVCNNSRIECVSAVRRFQLLHTEDIHVQVMK